MHHFLQQVDHQEAGEDQDLGHREVRLGEGPVQHGLIEDLEDEQIIVNRGNVPIFLLSASLESSYNPCSMSM